MQTRMFCSGSTPTASSGDAMLSAHTELHGTTIVIVGGDKRSHAISRLRRDLQVEEVLWADTRESDPTDRRFRALLQDPRVCLVVLLIGLVRHQHAHDVARLCKNSGKRLIRLWRSPSPAAISHEYRGFGSRHCSVSISY